MTAPAGASLVIELDVVRRALGAHPNEPTAAAAARVVRERDEAQLERDAHAAAVASVRRLADGWEGEIGGDVAAAQVREALAVEAPVEVGKVAPFLIPVDDDGDPLVYIHPPTREWAECAECGNTRMDEDACCAFCGADVAIVNAWDPPGWPSAVAEANQRKAGEPAPIPPAELGRAMADFDVARQAEQLAWDAEQRARGADPAKLRELAAEVCACGYPLSRKVHTGGEHCPTVDLGGEG